MHPRSITSVALAAICFLAVYVSTVRSEDPKKVPAEPARAPQTPHKVIERGLSFLETTL